MKTKERYLYRCPLCNSENIQEQRWVNPNTEEIGEPIDETDKMWCNQCEKHIDPVVIILESIEFEEEEIEEVVWGIRDLLTKRSVDILIHNVIYDKKEIKVPGPFKIFFNLKNCKNYLFKAWMTYSEKENIFRVRFTGGHMSRGKEENGYDNSPIRLGELVFTPDEFFGIRDMKFKDKETEEKVLEEIDKVVHDIEASVRFIKSSKIKTLWTLYGDLKMNPYVWYLKDKFGRSKE